MKVKIIASFLLLNSLIFGQANIDSLRRVFDSTTDDSAKIEFILSKLGYAYETVNSDSALYFYNLAQNIAIAKHNQSNYFKKSLGDIHRSKAAVYQLKNDFLRCRNHLDSAYRVYEKLGNKRSMGHTLVDVGIANYYQGFYTEAIQAYLKAIDIFNEIGLKKPVATTYGNIAIVQAAQKHYEEALENYFKSLNVIEQTDDKRAKAYLYNNIGATYMRLSRYSEAMQYFQKATELFKIMNDKNALAVNYANVAQVYRFVNDTENSLFYLEQSLKISEEIDNQVNISMVLTNISSIFLDLAQKPDISEPTRLKYLQAAILHSERNLSIAQKGELLPDINKAAGNLFKAYKLLGQYEKAVKYAELFIETQDSLFRSEKNKTLDELVARHENEKLLKQQQFDREVILRQQEVNAKQKIIIQITVLALILVLTLTILLIRWYRLRQKAYAEIERKNYLLERANKEIVEQHEELKKINVDLHQANEEIRTQRDYMSELNEELQQKNQQLEQTQAKLIESEKMASLGILTAGIAHEINNPINFVFAGANCLKRDFGDVKNLLTKFKNIDLTSGESCKQLQEIIDYFRTFEMDETIEAIDQTISDIHLGAVRAAEIVTGLKSFSRAETSEWIQYDLNAAIDGVLILLKNNYKNRIEIIKELDTSLTAIDCLGGKINQVIMNLLSNAIDAIDGTGKIFIKTQKVDGFVELSMRDTGVGIPEEVRKKIFDPFYTTKPVGKGTGLGLSITYGIVQEHHGSIEVNSKPGEGTEFVVRLPIRRQE